MNTDEKLLIAIIKISELYKKVSSSMLKNYGLTFAQHTALRVLEASVDGQSRITAVSKTMLVSGANLTGVAKRLAKTGLIIKKDHPKDERVTFLQITPKGRQLLANISADRDKLVKQCLQDYSDQEIRAMLTELKKCLNRLKSLASEPSTVYSSGPGPLDLALMKSIVQARAL
jgi:DNA-binding MarR family transcriptional regulator